MNQVPLQCFKLTRGQAKKFSALATGALARMSGSEQLMFRQQFRLLSTTNMVSKREKDEVHPGYAKLRKRMEEFQVDDGVPVHLKGGPWDKVIYYITVALCVVGIGMCMELYYSLSFPPKKQ